MWLWLWSHLQQLEAKHNLAALVYSCACKPSRPAHLCHHSCPQAAHWHSARFLTHRPGPHLCFFPSFFLYAQAPAAPSAIIRAPCRCACPLRRSLARLPSCLPRVGVATQNVNQKMEMGGRKAFGWVGGNCGTAVRNCSQPASCGRQLARAAAQAALLPRPCSRYLLTHAPSLCLPPAICHVTQASLSTG